MKLPWQKDKSPIKTKADSGAVFYPIDAADTIRWTGSDLQHLRDFLEVPEINAVINYKARAFSNMRLMLVDKATGDPITIENDIFNLFNHPNWFQSRREFLMQTKIFHEIYGNEYLYKLTPVGMPNNIKALFTLPPNLIEIDSDMTAADFFIEPKVTYQLAFNGKYKPLDNEDILHLNDNRVDTVGNGTSYLKGISKLSSYSIATENLRAAYESRNIIIVNRGALGIMTNDTKDGMGGTVPYDEDQKELLQKEYLKYGTLRKQWQIIITNMALKWQQTTIDANKLQLYKETTEDTLKICDAHGLPFELLATERNTTFSNLREAKRQLYQDTIIPEADEWVAGLNKFFGMETQSYELKASYSHIPIFQENEKERAISIKMLVAALSQALADNAITVQQYQRQLEKFNI